MTTTPAYVDNARQAATRAYRDSRDAQRRAEVEDALAHFNTVIGDRREYRSAGAVRWMYRHRVECAPLGAFVALMAAGTVARWSDYTSLITAALLLADGIAVLVPGRKWKSAARRIVTLSAIGTATTWLVLWMGEAFTATGLTIGLAAGVTAHAIPWFLAHRPTGDATGPDAEEQPERETAPEPEPMAYEALDYDLSFWQHLWSQAGYGGRVQSVENQTMQFRVLTVQMDSSLGARDIDVIARHLGNGGARTVTIHQDPADPATLYAYVSDTVRYGTEPRSVPEATAQATTPGPAEVSTTSATGGAHRRRPTPPREREIQP